MDGMLERTKASGSDRGGTVLPIFVSREAWISADWFLTGLALWQECELVYRRDYLLVLSNQVFAGTCLNKARYLDA